MTDRETIGTGPLLGVLGGMGPRATADFYRRLVEATRVTRDQEHVRVVMWADPTVPDRTTALLGQGPSPLAALYEGVRWLERAGAALVAMPCNTAHAYRAELQSRTTIEILDMVDITLHAARRRVPALRRVGVLATRGTRQAGLYEKAAAGLGLQVVHVEDRVQQWYVDRAIGAVKSGADLMEAAELVELAVYALASAGAEAVISGCTEISVALGSQETSPPVVDSTNSLVEEVIDRLGPAVTGRSGADLPTLSTTPSATDEDFSPSSPVYPPTTGVNCDR